MKELRLLILISKLLTPRFVNQCHERNLKLFTWTVNEEADMQAMIELGVDGVITNYPEKLIELREKN